jgi:hypothetical protein
MKSFLTAVALLALAPAAFAEPQASVGEQALSDQLMQEINQTVQIRMQLVKALRDLTEAQNKIKELEKAGDKNAK